jgi:hypothetical protein
MNSLSLINSSLEIDNCSTMLSNHDRIRFVRFISKIKVGIVKLALSVITFNTLN